MKRIAILIDGGHLRVLARKVNSRYTPDFIEAFSHNIRKENEEILRVLYYDCAPFTGTARRPITRELHRFEGSDDWLTDLASRNLFAVRRGVLKFRGWKPKKSPASEPPTDDDYSPQFMQKGVDLRIGLDVAVFSNNRSVERIALVTGDTDLIPAMKLARRSGLQVVGIETSNYKLHGELAAHVDIKRMCEFPD